ncbi:hypothetical protein ACEPAF_5362 [Sanghuangporus sanghuang]
MPPTRRVILGLTFVALMPGDDVFNLKRGGGVGIRIGIASVKAQSGGVAAGEYFLGLGTGDVTGCPEVHRLDPQFPLSFSLHQHEHRLRRDAPALRCRGLPREPPPMKYLARLRQRLRTGDHPGECPRCAARTIHSGRGGSTLEKPRSPRG